jgi:diguanylate cyclase (GGDEF)-like protein
MMPQLGADEVESTREAVLTHTDALTGLGNRRRMREKVEGLAAERAEDPAPFTIGLANLDGFKPINDLFGHGAGDVILTQVAHRLKACMPDGATVVRLGNDEFGFVLPLVFDSRGAEKMARLIKDVLSAPFDLGARTVRLTASFGFSVYPFAGTDFDSLMSCAETALYRSKRRGRSQITVYSQEIAEEFRRATELEQRSSQTMSPCISSRSCAWPMARSWGSRRSRAGMTPSSASCRRTSSSRLPRNAASSTS